MRRRSGLIGIASVVALGVAVLPGSPAAAEEYWGECEFGTVSGVFEITSGDGQAQPGGTFTFGSSSSNLRVQKDTADGFTGSQHLVVSVGELDDQVIPLGSSFVIEESGPEFGHRVWDQVPNIELDAPEELGTYPITAVLVHYDYPNLDTDCVLEGGPFAQVVVSDTPTTTTTTTTTVPAGNGNGDNGENGNGENGNGTPSVPPGEEAVEDAVDEVAEEVGAAERALRVGAAPRFTG